MPLVTLAQFKKMAGAKTALPAGLQIQKRPMSYGAAEIVSDRVARFTVSTADIDRDNDTISVDGWDVTEFQRNPVGLWQHGSEMIGCAPVAKVIDIGPDAGSLKAAFEFQPPDMPIVGDWAEMIYRSLMTGFLSATSVGFMPLEWDIADDRDDGGMQYPVNFRRQRLMEISVVAVPSNPYALLEPAPSLTSSSDTLPLPGNPPPVVQDAAAADIVKAAEAAAERAEAACASAQEAERQAQAAAKNAAYRRRIREALAAA